MGISLTPEEQFEIFGTTKMDEYAEEARERWGSTDAWKEFARRTATNTKGDWVEIKAEADANFGGFTATMAAGEPADGPVAKALAEEHRAHLCRWFFDPSPEMHCGIADLYVSDRRYMQIYDQIAPGFSQYVHDAVYANALSN